MFHVKEAVFMPAPSNLRYTHGCIEDGYLPIQVLLGTLMTYPKQPLFLGIIQRALPLVGKVITS